MFRRVMSVGRKNFGLILIVLLGFLAWNAGLFSIFSGETGITWQGQAWAYKTTGYGAGIPALNEDIASFSAGCNNIGGGCTTYMRSDFDLSKYSEVRLRMVANTQASLSGSSASASATSQISLDDQGILTVSSAAEERGGTNVPSDADSLTQVVVLKHVGNAWEVYESDFKTKTISNNNPTIKFLTSVGGNYGTGSAIISVQVQLKMSGLSFAPPNPAPPSLASFLSTLKSWLSRILDAIPFLTITGSQSPALGTTQTYAVSLTSPSLLDSDYADGTYAVRYCNVALMRVDGTIVNEKGFESCSGTYSTSYTAAIPAQSGRYAVVAVMTESKGTFDVQTQTWQFAPYEIVAQEALNVDTKAPIPGSSVPLKPTSSNIFAKIWASLFGWLFR